MSVLENTLNELIAADFGIRPEDVTDKIIREWRRTHRCQEDDTDGYGGLLSDDGLDRLTDEEVQEALLEVDNLIAEFSK